MVAIRRLDPTAWAAYREVRLASLADSPGAFVVTLDQALERTDADWRASLLDQSSRVTFAAFDGPHPVGLVAGVPGAESDVAELASMWVSPRHRRRALGRRLVGEVVAWARAEGFRELRLWVVEGNAPARGLYRRLGFAPTGSTQPYPNDDEQTEIELAFPLAGASSL